MDNIQNTDNYESLILDLLNLKLTKDPSDFKLSNALISYYISSRPTYLINVILYSTNMNTDFLKYLCSHQDNDTFDILQKTNITRIQHNRLSDTCVDVVYQLDYFDMTKYLKINISEYSYSDTKINNISFVTKSEKIVTTFN